MMLAYWGYVLMCVHALAHLTAPMHKLADKHKSMFTALCIGLGDISLYGCLAFVKRGFPGYMTGSTAFAFFDFSEPIIFFFLDYLAIMVIFMMVGCVITHIPTRLSRSKQDD